jgi:hypothetical protein
MLIFSFSERITTFRVHNILLSSPASNPPTIMKTLKIAGIVVGILVLGVFALMFSAPSSSHVESTIIINASTASVFREASTFKNTDTWSPIAKIDPDAQYTYEGPDHGTGARIKWDGPSLGKGYQEIIETVENSRIKNKFVVEGSPGIFLSEMLLEPVDGGTKVTWKFDSDYSQATVMSGSLQKVVEMFFSPNIQEHCNDGLNELKRVVELHEPDPKPATASADSTANPQ